MSLIKLTIRKIHNNAEFALFSLIDFDELHDVRVVQNLEEPCFLKDFFFLLFAHSADVDLLHYALEPIRLPRDQVGLTK